MNLRHLPPLKMSNKPLLLICMIYPDPDPHGFSVTIKDSMDTSVDDLKLAIKARKSAALNGVDADTLKLWKVSIPEGDNLEEELKRISFDDKSMTELIVISRKLYSYFPDPLIEEHIHVLVQVPRFPKTGKLCNISAFSSSSDKLAYQLLSKLQIKTLRLSALRNDSKN